MVENKTEQVASEELDIEIVEEATDQNEAQAVVQSDDELDEYTKGVSKRVNKLTQRAKEAEQRAQYLEQVAAQKDAEINALRTHTNELGAQTLLAEEQSIEAKEQQANELYKKAVESGDAELMSKADTLKSDLSIQKEKVRMAKNRKQQPQQAQQVQQVQPQVQQQADPQPTREALDWASKNTWYGDQSNQESVEATQFAYFTHFNLVNEGFEADSDDYYNELNKRVFKVYPSLDNNEKAEVKDDRPSVQRVASASVGSRQKTQAKKKGVTFSKSEVDRLRGLKPYNMSEDDWLKRVAQEKQKISQREVI
jgi:hypothetical protein|tara:strand:+ start:1229 stop:2158 length:930 start_codon:yes stop_codon:yes gene_type:complete